MSPRHIAIAALVLAAPAAFAQSNGLQNGGFETTCFFCGGPFPEGWTSPGNDTFSQRRAVNDGLTPTIYPIGNPSNPPGAITPHSGSAVVELRTPGNGGFKGVT